ncbi:MAG: hypothetical protein WDO12_02090 [Pseudomonadota bacterium]
MNIRTLVLTTLLLPVLGTQFACTHRFPDPRRFEAEIVGFEQQDKLRSPPQGAIVLTGSSSMARWNNQAQAALAPLTVIPRGFGGSVMHDLLYYLDRALVYKPRAIVIYEGDNDTADPGIPDASIAVDLGQIIARITRNCRRRVSTCCRSSPACHDRPPGPQPSRSMRSTGRSPRRTRWCITSTSPRRCWPRTAKS